MIWNALYKNIRKYQKNANKSGDSDSKIPLQAAVGSKVDDDLDRITLDLKERLVIDFNSPNTNGANCPKNETGDSDQQSLIISSLLDCHLNSITIDYNTFEIPNLRFHGSVETFNTEQILHKAVAAFDQARVSAIFESCGEQVSFLQTFY